MVHRMRARVPIGFERSQRLLTNEAAALMNGHPDCLDVEHLPDRVVAATFTGGIVGAPDHSVCIVVRPESDTVNRVVLWRDLSSSHGDAALEALPMNRVGQVAVISVEVAFRLSGGTRETTINLVATVRGADRSGWIRRLVGRLRGAAAGRREQVWVEHLMSGIVKELNRFGPI